MCRFLLYVWRCGHSMHSNVQMCRGARARGQCCPYIGEERQTYNFMCSHCKSLRPKLWGKLHGYRVGLLTSGFIGMYLILWGDDEFFFHWYESHVYGGIIRHYILSRLLSSWGAFSFFQFLESLSWWDDRFSIYIHIWNSMIFLKVRL